MADNFQSKVLVWAKTPPKVLLNVSEDGVILLPEVAYGFSLFINL